MNDFSLYLKKISTVYHVGNMILKEKNKNSYEGSGLSVSNKPESWIKICKLADKPIHEIKVTEPFLFLRQIKKDKLILNSVLDYCLKEKLIYQNYNSKTGFSGTSLMSNLFFQDSIQQCNLIDFCFIYFFIKKYNIYNFFWNYPNKPLQFKAPVGVMYQQGCFD